MAKAIEKMTTEELLAEKKKQEEAAKAAEEKKAAISLRLATQSIIDVVKTLRVPELFAKIREKASNAELTDTAILSAIAEAAGMNGITIAKVEKGKKETNSAPRRKFSEELRASVLADKNNNMKNADIIEKYKADHITASNINSWVQSAKKK